MNPLALLAPVFVLFEVWQLVVAERRLGIRQIKAGEDPRAEKLPRAVAMTWGLGLLFYYAWMPLLLLHPVGRAQGLVLLAVSVVGYALRAGTGLNWTLVILTFEGAVRIGMLVSLFGLSLRRLLAG